MLIRVWTPLHEVSLPNSLCACLDHGFVWICVLTTASIQHSSECNQSCAKATYWLKDGLFQTVSDLVYSRSLTSQFQVDIRCDFRTEKTCPLACVLSSVAKSDSVSLLEAITCGKALMACFLTGILMHGLSENLDSLSCCCIVSRCAHAGLACNCLFCVMKTIFSGQT